MVCQEVVIQFSEMVEVSFPNYIKALERDIIYTFEKKWWEVGCNRYGWTSTHYRSLSKMKKPVVV